MVSVSRLSRIFDLSMGIIARIRNYSFLPPFSSRPTFCCQLDMIFQVDLISFLTADAACGASGSRSVVAASRASARLLRRGML